VSSSRTPAGKKAMANRVTALGQLSPVQHIQTGLYPAQKKLRLDWVSGPADPICFGPRVCFVEYTFLFYLLDFTHFCFHIRSNKLFFILENSRKN
jgi:hypothetical protein